MYKCCYANKGAFYAKGLYNNTDYYSALSHKDRELLNLRIRLKFILTEVLIFSVRENLGLSRVYRPHRVRSVLTSFFKILPYRPSARLLRANYCYFLFSPSWFHSWTACWVMPWNQGEWRRTSRQWNILVLFYCTRQGCACILWHENRR